MVGNRVREFEVEGQGGVWGVYTVQGGVWGGVQGGYEGAPLTQLFLQDPLPTQASGYSGKHC